MLTIEPPFWSVRGATVFRDDADPDQLWVLPAPPTLAARPGEPGLTLYTYRHDLTDNPADDPTRARGGGLAFFDVESVPPPLGALTAEVATLAGRPDAVVSPVVFRSGTVRAIVAAGEGDSLVESVTHTTAASPVAPHRATFALELSPEGATLVEQAALGGALPVGVAYELRFLALTPALHARVRMSYDRLYDHFSASLGFTYYVQAKLDLNLAWLVENDLIDVEITAFTDEADAQRQRELVMGLVGARVQQDFFRSAVPATPPPGAGSALGTMLEGLLGGTAVSSASALFVLKARVEVVREEKDFELVYDGRTAVELTHVSTGLLSSMVAGGAPPRIQELDLDDAFFGVLRVEVVPNLDFDEMPDLTRAVVHLAKGDHRASVELAPDRLERALFRVPLTDPRDDAYTVSYAFHFDGDPATGGSVVTAGPFTTRSRVLVVDPLGHLDYVRVRLVLGVVDPALVARVDVALRLVARDTGEPVAGGTVTLDPTRTDAVWRHHLPPGGPYRVLLATTWEDPAGTRHDGERAELPAGATSFVVRGPFRDTLTVSVVPAFDPSSGATHAVVELEYVDGAHRVARTLTFLAADGAVEQTVDLPLLDPARRTYRWRQTVFGPGEPVATPWADADQRVLVVAGARPTTGRVRLVWVGDAAGAFGVRVDLRVTTASGEDTVSTFLRAGVDLDTAVDVPLDAAGRLAYRFEVRRIGPEGEVLVQAGETQTGLLVVRATAP